MAESMDVTMKEAARVFAAAAKQYDKLLAERDMLASRITELDAVLGQLAGAPSVPESAPRRRPGRPAKAAQAQESAPAKRGPGRPPKAAVKAKAEGAGKSTGRAPKGKAAPGARTFREILTELLTNKPSTFPEIVAAVTKERLDMNPRHISPMIAQLKKTGVVQSTGEARSFVYSLVQN